MAGPHPGRECRDRAQGRPVAQSAPGCHRLSDPGRRKEMKPLLVLLSICLAAFVVPAKAANIRAIDLGKQADVWFAEDHTVPIIAFNISLPGGSAYDPAGKAGLASFTASMMDEGAGSLDSKAFHEALANKAIS